MKAAPALLLLLLAGCVDAPRPAAPSCSVTKAAELAVADFHGFVATMAFINEAPVTMLVDTGSERLVVTPATAEALSLPPDPRRVTRLRGTGGVRLSPNALVQRLRVGGMVAREQSVAVAPLPGEGWMGGAAGLLGADWLSGFDVEFDLRRDRMALYRESGCGPAGMQRAAGQSVTPVQFYHGVLPIVPVWVNGTAVVAVLDTGANRSVLGLAAARRAGLPDDAVAADGRAWTRGVDGTVQPARVHRFTDIRVGDGVAETADLLVAPLGFPQAEMLLGADWLRRHHVWLSYPEGVLTVAAEP